MLRAVNAVYWAAAGVRFSMELAALASLAWWGWSAGGSPVQRASLAVAAPLAAAVVWGLFCSPKAAVPLPLLPTLAVQALVLGAAAWALLSLGKPVLAGVFAVLVVASAAVLLAHEGGAALTGAG